MNKLIQNIFPYYLYIALSSLRVGFCLILLGWMVFEITGDISAVGCAFIFSNLTSILLGPYIGGIIDKNGARTALIAGQILLIIGTVVPLTFRVFNMELYLYSYYVMTVIGAIAGLLTSCSLAAILQTITQSVDLRRVTATINLIQQIFLTFGIIISGIIIKSAGDIASFILLLSLTLLLLVNALFLASKCSQPLQSNKELQPILDGFKFILINKPLLFFISISALIYSTTQFFNLFMPKFVKESLSGGSDIYGFIEASWVLGGIIISSLLSSLFNKYHFKKHEVYFLFLLGSFTMLTYFIQNTAQMALTYCIMGMCFSMCKIICESQIIILSPHSIIGRVKAAASVIISILGIAIYLLPTIYTIHNIRLSFLLFGLAITTIALAIYHFCPKPEN